MIGRVAGRLVYRAQDHVLIDVRGVGYLVHVSERVMAGLPRNGEAVALSGLPISPSDDFAPRWSPRKDTPDDTEYEGHMGNYAGNVTQICPSAFLAGGSAPGVALRPCAQTAAWPA